MEIKRIKINGFKNINDVNIELKEIVGLLSVNSYGKSNFLNGISFGIDFIHAPINLKSYMMNNYDSYKPFNKNMLYEDFSFEIELIDNENDQFYNMIYGYSFAWKKNNKQSKIVSEYLKVKEKNSQKYSLFIKRQKNQATYKSSITGSCTKNISVGDNELLLNKLVAYDNLFFLSALKEINDLYIYVDSHFNTNNFYDVQPILRKNLSDYNFNDDYSSVPRTLFKIKNDFPDKYELIVNTLKDIFPFIKDIKIISYGIDNEKIKNKLTDEFYATNTVYLLFASDENLEVPIEFSNMSDGVRRVLLILITLVLADLNNYPIVAIEEPENSLNPKILQRYLIVLNSFAKNTKIIMTSHSPYLINYLSPEKIYLGLPNNDGIAKFSKVKDKSVNKLLNDSKNMEMLIGDYLFSLMSGDDSDLETIFNYVE